MIKFLKNRTLFMVCCIAVIVNSCTNDKCDVIPDVRVDFTINLYTPPFDALQSIGNSVEVPIDFDIYSRGYFDSGIIVYRKLDNEFNAFDRTCTFEHATPTAVSILKDDQLTAQCPECKSKFHISSGAIPVDGSVATCPLKEYHAEFAQTDSDVRVFNF